MSLPGALSYAAARDEAHPPTLSRAMTTASLLWGVVFGSVGTGYCVYAKKQRAVLPFLCGVALMVLPYFLSNPYALVAACSAVAAVPLVL